MAMIAHTIAAMRDVIASGKDVCQEPLSQMEKDSLRNAILTAEMVLRNYIVSIAPGRPSEAAVIQDIGCLPRHAIGVCLA